jgi:hypothetical protein
MGTGLGWPEGPSEHRQLRTGLWTLYTRFSRKGSMYLCASLTFPLLTPTIELL